MGCIFRPTTYGESVGTFTIIQGGLNHLNSETLLLILLGTGIVLAIALIVLIFKLMRFLNSAQGSLQGIRESSEEVLKRATDVMIHVDEEIERLDGQISQLKDGLDEVMYQVNETLKRSREVEDALIKGIESFGPIINSVQGVAQDIEYMTKDVRHKVNQVSGFFDAAEDAAKTVRSVTGVVRSGLWGLAVEVASLATGAKASLEYISKGLGNGPKKSKKGGG